ncbi:MAG: hypothetical protein VX278_16415, partial [Myxococcota bacterium]|nr:hypothetical protein [Myxococcota bacterium]
MTLFKQYVYGKRTESPTGPILGMDYECTGKSEGLPVSLEELCRPFRIGPGIDELTPWGQYKWSAEGGYALEVHCIDKEDWIIASKTVGRSEKGEGIPGRIYTQAHYLMIKADAFYPRFFRSIIGSLSTVPMQNKNDALPACMIEEEDRALPVDWCDRIAPLIRSTMSGVPLSWQDTGLEKETWLDLFSIYMCALPLVVCRKISLRIQAWEMKGEVALAHGQRAMGGVRMLKEEVRGDQEVDWSDGDRYLSFLRTLAVTTEKQLHEAVQKEVIPKSKEGDWKRFAKESVAILREKDLFRQLQDGLQHNERELPDISKMQYYRENTLTLLLNAVEEDERVLDALLGTSTWVPEWTALSDDKHRVYAYLIGALSITTADELLFFVRYPFPESYQRRAEHKLEEGLAVFPIQCWSKGMHEEDGWWGEWKKQNPSPLFWIALGLADSSYKQTDIYQRLCTEEWSREELQGLISHIPFEKEAFLEKVTQKIMRKNPLQSLRIVEMTDGALSLRRVLNSLSILFWEYGKQTASQLLQTKQEWTALEVRLILAFLPAVQEDP